MATPPPACLLKEKGRESQLELSACDPGSAHLRLVDVLAFHLLKDRRRHQMKRFKMKRFKLLSALAVTVMLLGVLTGCTQPAAAPAPAPAPAATAMPAPTTATAPTAAPAASKTMTQTASATDTKYAAVDCKYGGEIKSIEAVDDNTVKFTLCSADVAFPSKVAFGSFAVHSEKQLQATGGGGTALVENPIGTGPYMFSQWVKGDSIILKANPNYWGPKPLAQTLIFKWSKEGAARLLDLQSGSVDGIDNPTRTISQRSR